MPEGCVVDTDVVSYLLRGDTRAVRFDYGLGFPAHRQFVKLVLRLPQWARRHLKRCVFLVRPVQDGFEVGFIPAEL
jgi:hypothetical protein